MRHPGKRTVPAAALAAALLALGAPALADPAATPPGPPPAGASTGGAEPRQLTLVTGDQVHVNAQGAPVRFEAGPGRAGMTFRRWTEHGQWQVRPADADPLIAAGRVDPRLFNISLLLDSGYEDAKRPDVPLLVAGDGARSAPQALTGTTRTRELPALGLAAVSAPKNTAGNTWNAVKEAARGRAAGKVWLNATLKYSLHQSVPLIGAPAAWQAGHTAKDVPVAVLDSGIDVDHPDFAGVLQQAKDFSNSPHGIKDTIGHGTHVSSIVAGSGAAGGGKQVGVAKDAKLFFGKVGDFGPTEDAALAGMTWAAVEHKAKAVNMSFGLTQHQPDPVSEAIERLSAAHGTLFVIAAGNSGEQEPVGHPATTDAALAVASSTKDGKLSDFSSRGPRTGDYGLKPEIAAPGSDIVAAKADSAGGERYVANSGTSMAAPHVTGAAAVLAGAHPDWSAARLKAALMSTAKPLAGVSVHGQGAGVVDLDRATKQQVTAEQGGFSLGYFRWPHQGQQPARKDVVYRNDGDTPVTLDLALSIADKQGGTPEAGQFGLSSQQITVPAKGSEKVGITVDPGKRVGLYGGWLTAKSGDIEVRTAVSSYVEEERYDLTVKVTGRDGTPAGTTGEVTVSGLDNDLRQTLELGADGTGTVRAAKGDYLVTSTIKEHGPRGTYDPDPISLTQQVAPRLRLDKDSTVQADARTAKRVEIDLDDPSLRVAGIELTALHGKGSAKDPCCTPADAPAYTDTDAPVYLGSLGGSAEHFRHLTHVTAVRPEISADIVAPQRHPLDLWRNRASPQLLGEHRLPVLDAKAGTPEDLAGKDLKDKLVLLTPPKDEPANDKVAAIGAVGAKAVLLVEPTRLKRGKLPVAVLSATEHRLGQLRELLGKGAVTVRLNGIASSPVSYDLAFTSSGKMTEGGKLRAHRHDLARIESTYRKDGHHTTVRPAWRPGLDGRTAVAVPESYPFRLGAPPVPIGATRTEYVTPGWWHKYSQLGDGFGAEPSGGDTRQYEVAATRFGRHGTHRREYNAGPFAARPGHGVGGLVRGGDQFGFNQNLFLPQPAAPGAPAQYGSVAYPASTGETTLSSGGKVIGRSEESGSGYWQVPAGPATYEIGTKGTYGGRTVQAGWTFRSDTTAQPTQVRLLHVTPQLALDAEGSSPAGKPLPVTVTAHHGEGTVQATLEVSLDGTNWQQVVLRKAGADFTGTVPALGKAGDAVWLRLAAEDGSGAKAHQTLHRAYTLR
ncbi:S8 family peptidase [Crossiella sp. CA198]|uniref:S8 family peptidase n=1 Tax=Crossiella sp. CA198 TaxID=3455607 RepID=UPI003F8D893E